MHYKYTTFITMMLVPLVGLAITEAPISAAQQALAERYVDSVRFAALSQQCSSNDVTGAYQTWQERHKAVIKKGQQVLEDLYLQQPFGAHEYALWRADDELLWFASANQSERETFCTKLQAILTQW